VVLSRSCPAFRFSTVAASGRLTIYDAKLDKEAPEILGRFLRSLEIFKRVLKEEEETVSGHESKQLSSLFESSHTPGAMWLHILLSTGFKYPDSIPLLAVQRLYRCS